MQTDYSRSLVDRALRSVGLARTPNAAEVHVGDGKGQVQVSTGEASEADGENEGGYLVPSNTTWSQILDYVHGSGDLWPFDLYQPGLRGSQISRDSAISYATLNRCVTLISAVCAQLLSSGNLHVVDRKKRRRTSPRINRVLELFETSPDGGDTAAYSWIEDCLSDYLLDGNNIVLPRISDSGYLSKYHRMSSWDTDVSYSRKGEKVYRLVSVDSPEEGTTYAAARDIIHVRWPRLLRYSRTRSTKEGLALSPVVALRPALDIGMRGDQYIRQWFTSGAHSKLHVDFAPDPGTKPLTPKQRKELRDWVREYSSGRQPLVTFGGKSSRIDDTPQDRQAKELREFQIHEVAKVFGVPAPLLGIMVTEWGQGIEQLAKLFYRFGARLHLDRYLSPFKTRLLKSDEFFFVDVTEFLRGDSDAIHKMVMSIQGDAQRPPLATTDESRHVAGLMGMTDEEKAEWRKERREWKEKRGEQEAGDDEDQNGGDEEDLTNENSPPIFPI